VATITIDNVRVAAYEVPTDRPESDGTLKWKATTCVICEVTAGKVTGLGYTYSDASIARLINSKLASLVIGKDAFATAALHQVLKHELRNLGDVGLGAMAVSALDVALWDALAIASGQKLAAMLGGEAKPVRAYNSSGLGLMGPQATAEEALKLLEGGFSGVKLRLGYPTLEDDVAVARAVRKAVPDHVAIQTDYNQALTVAEAIRRGRALEDEGIYWIEEPPRHDDWRGNAAIARALHVPLQLGENLNGPEAMLEAVAEDACDYVMPDVNRIGGVTGWLHAAGIAAARGMAMSSHLLPEISVHLLAATPTCHWLEYVDWADAVLEEPAKLEKGHVVVPSTPGTGVRWNEKAIERFKV